MRSVILLVGLMACAGSPPNNPTSPSSTSKELDTCAGDPWLAQILGAAPELSSSMQLASMKRTRLYGPAFATRDVVEMDHMGDLQGTRSAAAETYEWEGPPRAGSSSGHETSRVTILRKAFGDPLALKTSEGEALYGAPSTLASGAMEYPPTKVNASAPFGPEGGRTLFTFSDGTWVEVDQWMAQRFRPSFASSGPPPAPPSDADTAWEICATIKPNGAIASGVWGTPPLRGVLRFYANQDADAELLFRFASPELAQRARLEQQNRCAQGLPHGPDKGFFSFVPPCEGVPTSDGPFLRYPVRFSGSVPLH
jgi:hypothetical protein